MYGGDNRVAYSPSAPRHNQDNRLSVGVLPPGNRKCENEDCVTCTWLIEVQSRWILGCALILNSTYFVYMEFFEF